MKNLLTIFRRETGAYFNSAIAYIFAIVFVVFNNGLFMLSFFQAGKSDMRVFFASMPFVLSIFISAATMRLWAEEKRTSTYEMLLTLPMRPHELVLGKFLAGFAFYLVSLAATLTIPVMISLVGSADMGPILGGYLGAVFLGALFLAIGIFISGLCKDQIVAFILTMIATFMTFMIGTDFFAQLVDGWAPGAGTFVKNAFGAASHLTSFSRGIVDVKDALYFVTFSAAFLFLNGMALEGRFRPKAKAVYAGAAALAILGAALVNWLVHDVPLGRHDMTEGKIHTISDVTRRVLRELKVPVRVKYYVSPPDHMPTPIKTLELDARDKLEELKIASGGNLDYSIVHVEAGASEDERRALSEKGIVPFQVESVQQDEVGVKLIYSSMTVEYKEKPQELLPRIVPASLVDLEYQMLSRIKKMTLEERPKIAVFAPVKKQALDPELEKLLAASGADAQASDLSDAFRTAVQLIRGNGYEVARVGLTKDDPIPAGTKLLLVLAPGTLNARQRWELGRFVHEGGTAVIAAQGYEFQYARESGGVVGQAEPQPLDINELIGAWGVRIGGDWLLDLNSQVISLSTGQRVGPFALEMPVKLPNQIVVEESAMNREAALTNRLPSVFYLWGSALDLEPATFSKHGLKATTLFTSSPRSWRIPNAGVLNEANAAPPASMTGKYPLAVQIEGQFPHPAGAGAPPAWKEGDAAETAPALAPKPGRLVVIGNAKTFSEELITNAGNLNLFANVIDGLVLGTELVEIRSKMPVLRDIKRLTNAEKFWYRFFTVALVPLILAAVALVRFFIRKKEKEIYLAARNG